MRVGALLCACLLAASLTGCLGLEEKWRELEQDLEADPTFHQEVLYEGGQDFDPSGILDPQNPPSGADGVGAQWNTTFVVPNGTRSMSVVFAVNFTQSPPQPPDPLPQPTNQEGEVRVFIRPAANASATRDEFYQASGAGGFDFRGPSEGDWILGFDQAKGVGNVTFRVDAITPIR